MEQPNTTGLTDKEVESIYQSPREVLRPSAIKCGDFILETVAREMRDYSADFDDREAWSKSEPLDTIYVVVKGSTVYDRYENAMGIMFTLYDLYTRSTVKLGFTKQLDVVRRCTVSSTINHKLIPFMLAAEPKIKRLP